MSSAHDRPDDQQTDPVHETFVGAARTPLRLSRADYDTWLSNIRADEALMADIAAVQRGEQRHGDLDEGDAGVFEGRIFPHAARIGDKLTSVDARARQVLLAALLPRILTDLARS